MISSVGTSGFPCFVEVGEIKRGNKYVCLIDVADRVYCWTEIHDDLELTLGHRRLTK